MLLKVFGQTLCRLRLFNGLNTFNDALGVGLKQHIVFCKPLLKSCNFTTDLCNSCDMGLSLDLQITKVVFFVVDYDFCSSLITKAPQ